MLIESWIIFETSLVRVPKYVICWTSEMWLGIELIGVCLWLGLIIWHHHYLCTLTSFSLAIFFIFEPIVVLNHAFAIPVNVSQYFLILNHLCRSPSLAFINIGETPFILNRYLSCACLPNFVRICSFSLTLSRICWQLTHNDIRSSLPWQLKRWESPISSAIRFGVSFFFRLGNYKQLINVY